MRCDKPLNRRKLVVPGYVWLRKWQNRNFLTCNITRSIINNNSIGEKQRGKFDRIRIIVFISIFFFSLDVLDGNAFSSLGLFIRGKVYSPALYGKEDSISRP